MRKHESRLSNCFLAVGLAVAVMVCLPVMAPAQDTEHTIHLKSGQSSPHATIKDVAWMAGYYRGDGLGGVCEEIWSEPIAGNMMGSFRHIEDTTVNFLELCTISEVDGTLELRIKHFNADLTGWEEKDEVQSFRLVKITSNAVYFNGITFTKRDGGGMNAYASVGKKDGTMGEYVFQYDRVDK